MFITEIDEEHANEKRVNALKPMNCPGHVQVYNQGIRSYKELHLGYANLVHVIDMKHQGPCMDL